MATTLIFEGVGPLPINGTFQSNAIGPAMLFLSGSGYRNLFEGLIEITLTINGQVAATAQVYANEAQSHKALVAPLGPFNMQFGPTSFEISLNDVINCTTDSNDSFQAALIF